MQMLRAIEQLAAKEGNASGDYFLNAPFLVQAGELVITEALISEHAAKISITKACTAVVGVQTLPFLDDHGGLIHVQKEVVTVTTYGKVVLHIDLSDNTILLAFEVSADVERRYASVTVGDLVAEARAVTEHDHFRRDWPRLRAYARLLASVSINVVCLNNVNVHPPAQSLITERFLPEVAELARMFATFGIRLMLTVDFSMPIADGLPTADPLDDRVQAWWRKRAALVYQYVPNLFGLLVKADSEDRPGPYAYGRTHAEGANGLARALKPYGGTVVWRCFVYNCKQNWRDTRTDRPMAAYQNYAGLDGQFDDNVVLQIKHGPWDFQVREPISPLLLAMPHTLKVMELQLTQEYTGQQIDLYAMQGMWGEVLADLPRGALRGLAAVANTGLSHSSTCLPTG